MNHIWINMENPANFSMINWSCDVPVTHFFRQINSQNDNISKQISDAHVLFCLYFLLHFFSHKGAEFNFAWNSQAWLGMIHNERNR